MLIPRLQSSYFNIEDVIDEQKSNEHWKTYLLIIPRYYWETYSSTIDHWLSDDIIYKRFYFVLVIPLDVAMETEIFLYVRFAAFCINFVCKCIKIWFSFKLHLIIIIKSQDTLICTHLILAKETVRSNWVRITHL